MTTDVQCAQDLYNQLKPHALRQSREYILKRTPPEWQEEMPGVIDADVANMASGAVAPAVVDRPFISQTNSTTLSCTLGNWTGTPTSRTYQWTRDAINVGTSTATYTITRATDVGHVFACTMVATNAAGSSAPSTSNALTAV
jgi:hypothetical protein